VDDTDVKLLSETVPPTSNPAFSGQHLPFVGFTFTQHSNLSDLGSITTTTTTTHESISIVASKCNGERTNPELTRKLQDEINMLTKKNGELESQLQSISNNSVAERKQSDSSRTQELETAIVQLRKENEDIIKDKLKLLENLKALESDLKTSNQQNIQRTVEFTDLSDETKELRTQKVMLARQLRDKEDDVEKQSQKIDSMRNDIRLADKTRRELETKLQETMSDLTRERQAKERSEDYCRQLQAKGSNSTLHEENFKREIERLDSEKKELLAQQQLRFNQEMNALRDQLNESETQRNLTQIETNQLREKLELIRQDITELEGTVHTLKKEKQYLKDENVRLTGEMEMINDTNRRLQNDQSQVESDYEELKHKRQAIANWEQQITEIIQWVSDEKDARSYLQALASKMTEELDTMKGKLLF
jgi:serine/threonine-protein kinase MRCK